MKNEQAKTRPVDQPYEVWQTPYLPKEQTWEWRVLKKWQVDDDKPYARWFCAVKSPFTYGSWEYGDVYVSEVKQNAVKVAGFDDRPEYGKTYALTGAKGKKCVMNGNTWKESEVEK